MSLLLLLTSCLPVLISARVNVVLIGATGDLANKYLLPAFFDQLIMDESLYLIPAAKSAEKAGQDSMNKALAKVECIEELPEVGEKPKLPYGTCAEQKARVKKHVASYKQLDVENEEHWKNLAKLITGDKGKSMRGKKADTANEETGRLIYLAIPPHFVDVSTDYINKHLRPHHEHPGKGAWLRVVIEKPFGLNREEAGEMADYIAENLSKDEILRNDHILSRAGLKAIHDLHTLNPGFEDRLHRDELARVEIGMYETADVSDDPIYYDQYGVIRDVMQSHVTELAIAVAMFADPNAPDKTQSHLDTKSETLGIMRAGASNQHYVAQYKGYTEQVFAEHRSEEEPKKKSEVSQTPTYAFVTMYFNDDLNDRWKNVPFLLTAGKKMQENKVFVRYVFKDHAYIEIIVNNDDGGAQIRISEGPHFSPEEIHGWKDWVDQGDSDVDQGDDDGPVKERVYELSLKEKDEHNPYWYVVKHALQGDRTKFVDAKDLDRSWDVWTEVLSKIQETYGGNHSVALPVYAPDNDDDASLGTDLTSHDLGSMAYMIEHMFPEGTFGEQEDGPGGEEMEEMHEEL